MHRGHVPELSERKETSCREWEWSPFEITGLIEIREEKEDQENWRLTILSHNSKRVNISRQFPFVEIPSISISQPTWTIFEEFQTLAHARKSSTSDDRSSFLAARFFEYEANLEALPFEDGLKGVREKSAGHLLLREEGRGESCSRIFITGHEQRHDKSKNSSPRAGDELLGSVFVTRGEVGRDENRRGKREWRRTLRAVMNTRLDLIYIPECTMLSIIGTPYRLWLWTPHCWWPTIRFAIQGSICEYRTRGEYTRAWLDWRALAIVINRALSLLLSGGASRVIGPFE